MIQVTRFDAAKAYDAKGHFGMTAMRLQGQGVTDLADYWVGFSTFLPGGGADTGAAPTGKVYVVLEGEGHIELDGEIFPLTPLTSVVIRPGCRHRAVGNLTLLNIPVPAFDPEDEWFDDP